VTNPVELQAALDSTPGSGVEALVAFPDSITFGPRKRIADFAIQHKLPTVSGWDAYADAGFLLIYGPSMTAAWERMAYFVDRILKGAKPADLPAEMPSVIEMIVNLKTAKALGIEVPQKVLLRANRVIE
jgi:putative ABC transport system substrate-binding protein